MVGEDLWTLVNMFLVADAEEAGGAAPESWQWLMLMMVMIWSLWSGICQAID